MKVKFGCATHDPGSKIEEVIEVDDDLSEDDLERLAEDFFHNTKEPEWWYERIEEGK